MDIFILPERVCYAHYIQWHQKPVILPRFRQSQGMFRGNEIKESPIQLHVPNCILHHCAA
jgi:hypothetical protein